MILKEGLHADVPEAVYHGDPCEAPSLSASIAKLLVSRSPLHAWTSHPKLNPNWQPGTSTGRQEIGTAAHALILGVGKGMTVVDAPDWRTKDAREQRDGARALGRVPILKKDAADVTAMVAAARAQLAAHEVGDVFEDCHAEMTMVWRDGPTWCRGRIDCLPINWMNGSRARVVDYKTTPSSTEPDAFVRRLYDQSADVQAAFYERGLKALYPDLREVEFLFVAQETDAPYGLSVVSLSNLAIGQAREKVDEAVAVWRACMAAGRWPGYPPRICRVDPPSWVARSHEERKETNTTPSQLLKVAMDWQRPHGKEAA